MNAYIELQPILDKKALPTINSWNRIEPRPRGQDGMAQSLKAEVRDALWMLTRQWQMGEFEGSDAGSPVFAKLQVDTTTLTKYQPDAQAVQPFEQNVPLEAKVERRPLPFFLNKRAVSLDIRLLMGRYWLKLIAGVGSYAQAYITA